MSKLLPPPSVGASDMDNAKQGQAQAAVKKPWSKPMLLIVEFDGTEAGPVQPSAGSFYPERPITDVNASAYDPNIS